MTPTLSLTFHREDGTAHRVDLDLTPEQVADLSRPEFNTPEQHRIGALLLDGAFIKEQMVKSGQSVREAMGALDLDTSAVDPLKGM